MRSARRAARLEIIDREDQLAPGARTEAAPDVAVNPVANRPIAAVGEQDVHPADVAAPRRLPGEADRDAIVALVVGRQAVVIEAVGDLAVGPLAAAVGLEVARPGVDGR